MRRYLPVFIVLVFSLPMTGCATRSQVWELEERVERLSEENGKLRQTLLSEGGSVMAQQDELGSELSRFAATQNAELYEMRTEIRRLSGDIEEIEYRLEQTVGEMKSDVTEELADYDRRLSRLENYLGIDDSGEGPAAGEGESSEETRKPEDMDAEELYSASRKLFDKGKYDSSLDGFSMFLERFPDSSLADNSRFWIGEIYFAEKWYEKAIVEYQKVIDDYPDGNKVPAAYLKQGLSFSLLGENSNALYILKELVRKFPDENEADIARSKIAEMER